MKALFFSGLLAFSTIGCAQKLISSEDSYTVRMSVKKAKANYDNGVTIDTKIYVYNGNTSWSGVTLYAKLIPADYFDNTSVNPTSNTNGFGLSASATCVVADPLNPGGSCSANGYKSVFEVPGEYNASAGLSTGEEAQTIGYVDFFGVKTGVYDLVAFVDTETQLECKTTPDEICTCTRATGCSPEDYAQYEIYKANDPTSPTYNPSLCHCKKLFSTSGSPAPSNGDVFYIVDNLDVNEANKTRIQELILQHDSDAALVNTGGGNGDGDIWDEWRCIYHDSALPGFSLHNYTFPKDTGNSNYCLPNTSPCPGGSNGTVTACGTMMDWGFDYNTY